MIRDRFSRRRFMRDHHWTHAHLSHYLDDDLRTGERHRVEQHVGGCADCRRVLAALKRTLEGLLSLATPEPPAGLAPSIVDRLRQEDRPG